MGRSMIKGRSITTCKHKVKKLERLYNKLCKASKKAKDKDKARHFYFHEKYPTFDKYRDTINIKTETKNNERSFEYFKRDCNSFKYY